MSNQVYPIGLPGMDIKVKVAPRFSTRVKTSVSMRETRAAFAAYPLWNIELSYEFLRSSASYPELDKIIGFFMQMRGSFDSFLLAVPNDNAVVDMPFGLGTGSQKDFPLSRARGAGGFTFTEPVNNVNAVSAIKANGSVVAPVNYSIGSAGGVSFVSSPAIGATLTWSGSFYYRCRFAKDEMDAERFMQDLWKNGSVQMTGSPVNKV